jgi:hypothetical protein
MFIKERELIIMFKRDGTGPMDQGSGTGSRIISDSRGGKMGGIGAGPNGDCECPKCGEKVAHQRGVPCTSISCPKCNTTMLRGE